MINVIRILSVLLLPLIIGCKTVNHLAETENVNIEVVTDQVDQSMESFIAPYRSEMEEEMQQVIGSNASMLTKTRPNSTLGNVVADLLQDQAEVYLNIKVDFAVQNYGGIRINSLSPGPITKGEIFELMPFDNYLLVLPMTKKDIILLCDRIIELNGWPISRGLSIIVKDDQVSDIMINGLPLEDGKIYQMAIPDYIANGGDSCDFLTEIEQQHTGKYIREALTDRISYLESQGKPITSNNEQRIHK